MKKNILYALLISSLILGSCTKDLNQDPITSKDLSVFLKNETEVEEYVNAVYGNLQFNGLYGLYMPAIGEIPTDNTFDEVPANDAAVYGDLDQFKTIPTNDLLAQNWRDSYKCIQKANVVLGRIDNITYQSTTTKNARIGEMKFIRALLYFNLVRTFGDVPLALTETTDPNAFFGQGRTVSTKVYDQIKKDLTEAIAVLPATTTQPGKVIKTAAQTLLGKVYLTLKDYANAKTQFDLVVTSAAHTLMANPSLVFAITNENNKEIIFSVQFTAGVNGNTEGSTMYQQFSPSATVSGAKGHNLPTKSLYNLYASSDLRKGAYVGLASTGAPYSNKLVKPTLITDGASDIVVLRYADVLLMLAETENELGNATPATNYLNQIRTRAGLTTATTATTQEDIRAAIDLERRFELIGEGHRWFDLLRTGNAVSVMNTWFTANNILITIDAHHLLMPIPQGQIDTDPSIKQNSGYN
jgi:hypothetical protein